ncbi:hypothetical protein NGC53_01460 [Aerococcus viridans]|nr:hypothetical protein [Aerococcus viridans]MEB7388489.1 hypothetical protein [Aerococcus viridans]
MIINITKENILSETAIAVKEAGNYHLRWFTLDGKLTFVDLRQISSS